MESIINKFVLFYKNTSIKNKLLLLFYIQIVIPLFFIGITSYQKSAEIIEQKSINYSLDILKMIELRFKDLSTGMQGLTLELLYDNRVYDALSSKGYEDNITIYNRANEIRSILRQATLSRNEIQSICLVTKNRRFYSFDSDNGKVRIEFILPYDSIVEAARKGRGRPVWFLEKQEGRESEIYVTRMVYDRDSYNEIGLIAINIKKEYLESVYTDLSRESLNNISILSENNEEIIKQQENSGILKNFYRQQLQGRRGFYKDNKAGMLVSYVLLEDPSWKIVYHIPLKELYREMDTLKRWVLLIIVYGLIILSVLSVLTSVDIITPINKLVEGMKKVEKGNKHEDIELDRSDELGYLSESFNRMSKKIDYLVNRIYKEEIALKEAEIKALQAQINPHFLFNTLENINWMARLNGVPEISETVSALAKLIDGSIGRGDRTISLKEELEYIDNYMTVLKNRYEDRLEVIKILDEGLMDKKIPRLLIQPLVENAVKHGIGKSRRKGVIRLEAFREEGHIVFEVEDNGMGMTAEELEALNKRLQEDELILEGNGTAPARKSIGLENVNRRIKLLYGSSYGVKIESSYDEYTKVTVRIPDEQVQEGDKGNV
ncbi:MAG TPA: sensor histidine kinase [Bacillota bacterium]|nr:sensor histidine kinase [Clostridiaceae bacterium]HNR05492.1 sensor histidine kinase [Bacillota bacterium]HNT04461.1 sensor histidine kinase [Bacillota bacterium]HPA53849.1 sensor histidine kinase [Bacillota bacterium]HPX69071.1 sensor histidine kinase [Bacillota bacterium]